MQSDTGDAARRTSRTFIQVLFALLPFIVFAAPELVNVMGLASTTGIGAAILAIGTLASRLMAIESFDDYMPGFLRKYPPEHGGGN